MKFFFKKKGGKLLNRAATGLCRAPIVKLKDKVFPNWDGGVDNDDALSMIGVCLRGMILSADQSFIRSNGWGSKGC